VVGGQPYGPASNPLYRRREDAFTLPPTVGELLRSQMKTAALIVVLAGLLAGVAWWAVSSVTAVGGFQMPLIGWLAMIIGVLVAVAIGVGLMALSFHSHRRGYDGPASAALGFSPTEDRPPDDGRDPSSAGR
jgi:hypothetical protein